VMPPVALNESRVRLRELANSLVDTAWYDSLSRAVGDDVVSIELGDDGVVVLVTAPGYRGDPAIFHTALYLGLYGLWKDKEFK
jgi:hypothetical protein